MDRDYYRELVHTFALQMLASDPPTTIAKAKSHVKRAARMAEQAGMLEAEYDLAWEFEDAEEWVDADDADDEGND